MRCSIWRKNLMGNVDDILSKRRVYYEFIHNRTNVSDNVRHDIAADIPRTWPEHPELGGDVVQELLIEYAATNQGDSYLQGFNYSMTILWKVFESTEHARADTWWCFSRIVGMIRPLMPDFNTKWFEWYRIHWFGEFRKKIYRTRPIIAQMLTKEMEMFSSLITVKWFMLWFTQTVPFEEIFQLWDFLISVPPSQLMKVYTMITVEIIQEIAPTVTYNSLHNSTNAIHQILNFKVSGVENLIQKVQKLI
jgi:hypothetical protein